jgi:hypothetical protein
MDEPERKAITDIIRTRGVKGAGAWGISEWNEWFDARLKCQG